MGNDLSRVLRYVTTYGNTYELVDCWVQFLSSLYVTHADVVTGRQMIRRTKLVEIWR